jgi:hypothetical protein
VYVFPFLLREPLHFNFFKDAVFSGLRAGYFVVDEFLGGVEVFHEVIVVVEFDYVDVVFCFSWTNSRHPPFRLIIFRVAFVSQNPVVSSELSQSCVKDVFVGFYPPPKSENPGMLSESSSCRRGISVRRCGWLRVKCGRHHRYLRLRSVYIQLVYYNY